MKPFGCRNQLIAVSFRLRKTLQLLAALFRISEGTEVYFERLLAQTLRILICRGELSGQGRITRDVFEHFSDHTRLQRTVELLQHCVGPEIVYLAICQRQRPYPFWIERKEDLADTATRIVADQVNLLDRPCVQERR